MTQVTGVGGVFLRAADPDKLYAWYEEHLGIKRTEGGFVFFSEGPQEMTILAFFPLDTKYFGPGEQRSMLNFRVDDLDGLLDKLRAAGVDVGPRRDEADFGRFAWFNDPKETGWNFGRRPKRRPPNEKPATYPPGYAAGLYSYFACAWAASLDFAWASVECS